MTLDRKWQLMQLVTVDPCPNCAVIEPEFFGGLSNGHLSSIWESDHQISSPIVSLIFSCSPIAIFFRVAFVVVVTLYRQFWRWTKSHVIQKYLKGKTPFIGHSKPTGSVIFESGISRVVTASDDLSPNVVLRHIMDACASFRVQLSAKTSAAFAVARRKGRILNQTFVAAFAAAEPLLVFVAVGAAPQHCPASVLFSSDINDLFRRPTHIEQYALDSNLNQGK